MKTYKVQVFKSVLVRDPSARLNVPHIGDALLQPSHCAEIFQTYLKDADVEHFVVSWLDRKYRIIGLRTVSTGSLHASIVHPLDVFVGTSDGRVSSLVLGHNHPSGNTDPSKDDKEITLRLVQAGQILGITVLDHLIVGYDYNGDPTPYFSFADNGLMTP